MSPEIDLLERLAENLDLYSCAFGSCYPFRDINHARNVIWLFLNHNIVELYDGDPDNCSKLPLYQAKTVLDEAGNWEKNTQFRLSITKLGWEKFVNESEDYFNKLFSTLDNGDL